ncbi:MAG: tetratricopeptide repeat protein [Chloroflexota bacterium]
MNQEQGRANFFQQCVERMLTYWRDHEAIKNIDITVLDRERHRILKNIALGLDLQPLWPLVKKLVIAFAPYMERRGFWDVWHGVLVQTIRMAKRAVDVEAETTLTAFLARLCQRMNRPQDVVRHYRRVMELARQSGNQFEEARACSNLGYLYIDGGRWWRSEVLSQHALTIFDTLANDHGRAHTHNHLGVLYSRQKIWEKAESHLKHAATIWVSMDDQHGLIRVHGNLGQLYNSMAQSQKAIKHSKLALKHAMLAGDESLSGSLLYNLAVGYRQSGEIQQAHTHAKESESISLKFSEERHLAFVWHQLALIHLQKGELSDAVHYKSQALKAYRQYELQEESSSLITEFNDLRD